ncbi:MAG: hypothetical protein CMI01_05780 [Oceanospirillaceae bacterium]|nr:hypothetical protein [Oceanospirillaceae bacterium]
MAIHARALLLTSLAALTAACSQPDPARLKTGDELYDYYCRSCHQENGLGEYLENLTHPVQVQHHELVLIIRSGYRFEHPPLHLPQLSPEQADAVVKYAMALRR